MSAFTLPLALLGTACLPAMVAAILFADELARSANDAFGRLRDRWVVRRLDRLLRADGAVGVDLPELADDRPAIEHIAADLRRLGRQRLAATGRSRRMAIDRAYDERLRQACRSLGVQHHLDALDGIDREIERVRIEGELGALGLVLPAASGTGRSER